MRENYYLSTLFVRLQSNEKLPHLQLAVISLQV